MRASGTSRRVRHGLCGAALLAALLCGGNLAVARQGDARAGLFIGTTTYALDSYTTFGTTFGGSYGYEFQDDLMWTVGGAFSSTNGEATVQNPTTGATQVVDTSANTAALQTGLVAFFNRGGDGAIIPYVGAGLSYLNYDLNFPGTTIGTSSGTGPGAYASVGVELRLTRSFTIIPQLGLQVHNVKTQAGESRGLLSGGLIFTLRLST